MSERMFARPIGAVLVLLAALLAFPGLARADEKDEQIQKLQKEKETLLQLLEKQAVQVERLAQEKKAVEEKAKAREARLAELEKVTANLREQLVAAQLEARTI